MLAPVPSRIVWIRTWASSSSPSALDTSFPALHHTLRAPITSPTVIWDARFVQFRNEEELVLFHRLRFPERVRYLFGGPHDELARHSLMGWMVEADFLMERCPTHPLSSALIQQRDQTRPHAARSFTPFIPSD